MAKSNFIVRGGADFSGINKEIDKTEKLFGGFEGRINGAFKGISQGLGINLGGLTKVALIAGATKALVNFGKASIKVSSDLEEIQNVTDTVFGSMAKDVDEFSKNLIDNFGLGELSAKKYASYMGAMLKSSGIQGDLMKQMSKDLTLLTADMASFYNLGTEEMFQKLMSGMSGATMPLKQLGINMNIANLEAFALSQGIRKSWQEMNQAEQVMLRYNYLMSVTGDAQGDFARNSWTWANSTKILSEKWQEFMSIVGRGFQQIILPIVKGLIKVLDLLIKIATAIEKVFVMITGKKVDVDPRQVGIVDDYAGTMDDLGITAGDAAKKQKDLGKGIKDAAKAAKGALAPFDELNILQQNLAGSGNGGSGGLGSPFDNLNFNNNFKMDHVGDSLADGFKRAKDEGNKFFVWLGDWWNKVRQTLSIPITVPAPIFAAIPQPIYNPEWGLTPPLIPSPVFQSIPNPIYNPNWNLNPPPVPQIVFPAIIYTAYNASLEAIKKLMTQTKAALENTQKQLTGNLMRETTTASNSIQQLINGAWDTREKNYNSHIGRILGLTTAFNTELINSMNSTNTRIREGLATAWNTLEGNYSKHKENVGVIATEIATVLVSNIQQGLSTMGRNVNSAITTVQNNLNAFGFGVGNVAFEIARSFSNNLSKGFETASKNFSAFANSVGQNLKAFGSGFLKASAETAKGFVNNMVNGFQTAWNNFKSFMSAIGEKVGGFFNANKGVITTTAIVTGIAIGAGALALAAPQAIPFAAKAVGGLAAIPALAKGGITNGPMLAMIGDNPGGKEVVSPLDKLQDMLISAVGTALLQSEFETNKREPIVMQVNLEGKEIARAVYDPLEEEKNRRGTPIIQSI